MVKKFAAEKDLKFKIDFPFKVRLMPDYQKVIKKIILKFTVKDCRNCENVILDNVYDKLKELQEKSFRENWEYGSILLGKVSGNNVEIKDILVAPKEYGENHSFKSPEFLKDHFPFSRKIVGSYPSIRIGKKFFKNQKKNRI